MTLPLARGWSGLKARWTGSRGSSPAVSHLWPGIIPVVIVGQDGPDQGALNFITANYLDVLGGNPNTSTFTEVRGGEKGCAIWCVGAFGNNSGTTSPIFNLMLFVRPGNFLANADQTTNTMRPLQSVRWAGDFVANAALPTATAQFAQMSVPLAEPSWEIRFDRPILIGPNEVMWIVQNGIDTSEVNRVWVCLEEGF